MRNNIDKIVESVVKSVINEAPFKKGDSIVIPGDESFGRKVLRGKYNMNPDDFEYIGAGKFVYKMMPKKTNLGMKKKPKFKSQDIGKREDETEQEYLERVREINKKFAEVEREIDGEEWRPIRNKGRFFGGQTDYERTYEVSNMGRIRIVDLVDPMRSKISTGYDAPGKKCRNFHLNIPGYKTTPPVHTIVADAWLPDPPGGIDKYYVAHIDGNYHNNRADNLEYRPKKGKVGEPNDEMQDALQESIRRIVKESVRKTLKENEYKGIYTYGLDFPMALIKRKIDDCYEKGWSRDKIQNAIGQLIHNTRTDYMYAY